MDPTSLIIFLSLITLSAFFSGTEIALMSLSEHTVQGYVKEKRAGSRSLWRIKKKNDRLLITILIGNNLANVAASALATVASIKIAESFSLPGEYGIGIATGAVTMILLLFGEITPKSIASKYAGPISLAVAPFYEILMTALTPITVAIEWFVIGIRRAFGTPDRAPSMTSEELEAFIDISHEQGAVETHEHKKIKGVLDLSETEASSVMTPRVKVDFISKESTIDEAIDIFLALSHTRLPVYGEDSDDVDHVVTLREVLSWQKQGIGATKLADLDLEKIIKVPLTKPLDQIFETFQKSRKHIALVMDEYGGVAGIVTLEDIVEEVFWDIKDEKDREEVFIRRRGDGSLHVKGEVGLEDALEHFGNVDLFQYGLGSYEGETVSYVIIALLEAFPDNGETIFVGTIDDGFEFTVEKVVDNTIEDVRIMRKKKEEPKKPKKR